jgi:hypothetical protein
VTQLGTAAQIRVVDGPNHAAVAFQQRVDDHRIVEEHQAGQVLVLAQATRRERVDEVPDLVEPRELGERRSVGLLDRGAVGLDLRSEGLQRPVGLGAAGPVVLAGQLQQRQAHDRAGGAVALVLKGVEQAVRPGGGLDGRSLLPDPVDLAADPDHLDHRYGDEHDQRDRQCSRNLGADRETWHVALPSVAPPLPKVIIRQDWARDRRHR